MASPSLHIELKVSACWIRNSDVLCARQSVDEPVENFFMLAKVGGHGA
jgi:hypothetical protein